MIYFIGNKKLNICKIGYSKRPYRRIDSLRKLSPFDLEIFSIIDGAPHDEKMYHSKYFDYRIKGEWFKLDNVQELGFSKGIKELKMRHLILNINEKNGYVHLQSLLAQLNQDRIFERLNNINFNLWMKSNAEFLETINNPIIKETCLWVNIYVAFELIRYSTVKNKIILYENIYTT